MSQGMYKSYDGPRKLALEPAYFEDRSIPEPNTGCWLWLRAIDKYGYGGFRLKPHPYMSAHRGSFIAHRGPIADGLTVDHLCRVRCCVNPDHLEAVTHAVNCERKTLRDLCPSGHFRDGIDSRGLRYCKRCARTSKQKYIAKKRAKPSVS